MFPSPFRFNTVIDTQLLVTSQFLTHMCGDGDVLDWLKDVSPLVWRRGVARGGGGGANRPGRRVEGAPMKPTISTQLLFYRIILVGFPKTSLLIDVLAPPYWQKTDTIFQKYGNFGSRWSPTTKNRPTKTLICFFIAKFCEKFKRFRKFLWIKNFFGGGGTGEGAPGRGRRGGGAKRKSAPRAPKTLATPLVWRRDPGIVYCPDQPWRHPVLEARRHRWKHTTKHKH